jgi:hypothetical protein
MSEEKASFARTQAAGRLPELSYVGVDPADQLLIGPALAILRRARWDDPGDVDRGTCTRRLRRCWSVESVEDSRARASRDKAVGD